MKSRNKIKARIESYMEFFSEVSKRIATGKILPEELVTISIKYNLSGEIFNTMITQGVLSAFDVSIPSLTPVSVIRLYPKTPHVLVWKVEPNETVAFNLYLATLIEEQKVVFGEYIIQKICMESDFSVCPHCSNYFENDLSVSGFCSEGCKVMANKKGVNSKHSKKQIAHTWKVFLDAAIDLLHEIIPNKNSDHENP